MTTAPFAEAIVLCGGLGTRLRPVVADVPKAMAPVAGRPFLDYLLQHLRSQGAQRAILAVGYGRQVIMDHVGDRWGGLAINYSIETEPLGTGGALKQALSYLTGADGLVVNGDTLLLAPAQPLAAALADGADLALSVCWRADAAGCGVCRVEGDRLVGFEPGASGAGGWVNAGVYAARRGLLETVGFETPFSFERDVLERCASAYDVRVVFSAGDFIDIGLPQTYAFAQTLAPNWRPFPSL